MRNLEVCTDGCAFIMRGRRENGGGEDGDDSEKGSSGRSTLEIVGIVIGIIDSLIGIFEAVRRTHKKYSQSENSLDGQ